MTPGRIAGLGPPGDAVAPDTTGLDLVTEEVEVAGRRLRLLRPRSAEALISQEDFDRDERLPYWAELWPSGRVLAEALAEVDLTGTTLLELGSGIAIPSIVAAAAGARVLATDWYPEALAIAAVNARAAGTQIATLSADWFAPPPELLAAAPFDRVVAADVCYEERNAFALAELIPALTAPGGLAIVADPGRPYAPDLIDLLVGAGWRHDTERRRVRGRIDESGPTVTLHTFRHPAR